MSLFIQKATLSPTGRAVYSLSSVVDFDIFSRILKVVLFSFIAISLYADTKSCCHSLTIRKVCVGVSGDLCLDVDFGAPFSLLWAPPLRSSFLKFGTQRLFFWNCACDECLAILRSGGFETLN